MIHRILEPVTALHCYLETVTTDSFLVNRVNPVDVPVLKRSLKGGPKNTLAVRK